MNLSSPNVGIFEHRLERKRLRPKFLFPRHACAISPSIIMAVLIPEPATLLDSGEIATSCVALGSTTKATKQYFAVVKGGPNLTFETMHGIVKSDQSVLSCGAVYYAVQVIIIIIIIIIIPVNKIAKCHQLKAIE